MFNGYPITISEDGTYIIKTDGSPIVLRRSLRTDPPISGLCVYSFSEEQRGILGFGGHSVLSSADGCNFGKLFDVGEKDIIRAVYPRNIKEFYAGADHMYRTHYVYDLVNNTHNLNISEIKDFVNDMYPQFMLSTEDVVSSHIEIDHGSGTAISSIDSDAMDISMSNARLEEWQNISKPRSDEVVVVNDVVYRMEFGDQTNGDITVSCSNFISSWEDMKFSYIMKQWKSGMVEMMIYLPTTHTYYIGNLSGCPQYSPGDDYRPNISALIDTAEVESWSVDNTATNFSVSLDGSIYRITQIFGVEACGNSLPLGIYKDTNATHQISSAMYNSMILPSIVTSVPKPILSGMNTFDFQCFGTDAQAVQITYYDSSLLYDGDTFVVKYHPTGASGHMPD